MQGCTSLAQGGCITMKKIKDYAVEKGISHQAVYQLISTHKDELDGLIITQGRTRFLSEEAEAILDKYRNKAAIVIEKADSNERIQQLEQEVKQLLIKIASQADVISELSQWKADQAVAIAAADQNRLLLEEKQQTIKEKEEKLQLAEQKNMQLESELNSFERTLFGLYKKKK